MQLWQEKVGTLFHYKQVSEVSQRLLKKLLETFILSIWPPMHTFLLQYTLLVVAHPILPFKIKVTAKAIMGLVYG